MKIYRETQIWVKTCQKCRSLYMKVLVRFIVTGDADSP